MPNFEDLKKATNIFFDRHWDKNFQIEPYLWIGKLLSP